MCNAWNHYPGCDCGWGGGDAGGGWGGAYSPVSHCAPFSYTNSMRELAASLGHAVIFPTTCWYCGAQIYLYANEHGSFVIFDSPESWHKHSCAGWTPDVSEYSPPVSVRRGTLVAVPANARGDIPYEEGMKISGIVTDSRDVFTGRWVYRLVIREPVRPGQWVEGIARKIHNSWHLVVVSAEIKRPPEPEDAPEE